MNVPSFHAARESDAEQLLQFMREYYAYDGHHFDDVQTPTALAALLKDPSLGRVWLIRNRETPVGYVVLCFGYSLEWLGRDAFVDEFYLREEYRGRGWGRQTMAFLEEVAASSGIRALHLEVVQQNRAAHEIYAKLGFKEHHSAFMSKRVPGPQLEPVSSGKQPLGKSEVR